MRQTNGSAGDTIVEVLIALAVLTTVLVGAYVTANRSQNTTRGSQERGEAIKVAESQIEGLKGLLVSGVTPPSSTFCVLVDNTGFKAAAATPFAESLDGATLPYDTPECANRNTRYNVIIRENPTDTYEILVRWFRIGGSKDQINMYYRTY